jgi:hypothetical protein
VLTLVFTTHLILDVPKSLAFEVLMVKVFPEAEVAMLLAVPLSKT